MNPKEERAKRLMNLSDESLYTMIAEEYWEAKSTLRVPSDPVASGKKLFAATRAALHEVVCVKWNYCQHRKDPKLQALTDLVVAVADLIASAKLDISPFAAATLLVRMGLDKFCACE